MISTPVKLTHPQSNCVSVYNIHNRNATNNKHEAQLIFSLYYAQEDSFDRFKIKTLIPWLH